MSLPMLTHAVITKSARFPTGDGLTRVTFLREDTAGVRSLYLSLWSEDARLVSCEVDTSPLVTESYQTLCARRDERDQEHPQRFNVSLMLAPDGPCTLASSSAPKVTRAQAEGKSRRKRAWVFPGTLWCGTGSRAAGYEQLGMFESADRCCREHDHCLHIIPAFTVNYGVFNAKFFTASHCDCDRRFRQCLLDVNDTISHMVGYSFFNILQVPCFELQQQKRCTQMYWWGMCKVAKKAPYAIFHRSLSFNTTYVPSKYGNNADGSMTTEVLQVTERPAINPNTTSPFSGQRCSSKHLPRGDTFYRRRRKGKGCKRRRKPDAVAPTGIPSTSRARNSTRPMQTLMWTKRRRGGDRKSNRKNSSGHPTQGGRASSATTTAVTETTASSTEAPSRCCGSRMNLRGDSFRPHCKSCLGQNTTSPSLLNKATETPRQRDTWSSATTAAVATMKLTTAASDHEPQKQIDPDLLWNNTNQERMGRTPPNTRAERRLKLNILSLNLTDNHYLCRSLTLLDECKFKIPPLEKKFKLQNVETKTSFLCDCTSRLAAHINSFKHPSILPALLADFVSPYCFNMPKKEECRGRKSCFGGFTKASDLLGALKKIEEEDTAGVQKSGRKRGNPVRLYKRCLRLQREADMMAQLP